LFNVKQEISFTEVGKFDNKRNYKLTITGDLEKIEKQIKLFNEWPKSSTPSENKCFLIGAFLSGGSISSFATKSTYSLSLRSKNKNYLIAAQDILSKFNISVTIAERRNEHILYIKKASSLSDFLKIIGTNNKMLEFEEIIIARDYINQMHRLVNLDVSNMRKTSSASVKYITMINSIINTPEYNKQSAKFKTYCLLRKQNPGYSLDTLSKKMGDQKLPVTKGGINHLNMKIKKIYMSLNSKKL
jgi:DNA-binding protein WhiA